MPNTGNPSGTQTPNSGGRPAQSHDRSRQWRGSQSQGQNGNPTDNRDDNVEVGDPVPENERTIRASHDRQASRDRQGLSNGQGETGEDEGLSGDVGDEERH
jgi:hypothetical protein